MSLMADVYYGNEGFKMDKLIRDDIVRDSVEDRYGLGTDYYNSFISAIDDIKNSSAYRLAKSIIRRTSSYFENAGVSDFRRLDKIGRMQNPIPVMLPYILSNPEIRKLRENNIIEGYRTEYTIPYSSTIAPAQVREYRQVVSGLLQRNDDKTYIEHYIEPSTEDSELTIDDQLTMAYNWVKILNTIEEGDDDPTSPTNAAL